jgi:N-acetylated-alpha-linked acidic dipeptidase
LQFASLKFDAEKFAAERVLKDQLGKWRKKHPRKDRRKDSCMKRFTHRLKSLFTWKSHDSPVSISTPANERLQPNIDRTSAWIKEWPETGTDGKSHGGDHEVNIESGTWPHLPLPKRPHWPGRKPDQLPPKLIKAAKAVRKINKKLASFERGFIHEGGIKDREWYRHLGVAPGKWLGTTLLSVDVWMSEDA